MPSHRPSHRPTRRPTDHHAFRLALAAGVLALAALPGAVAAAERTVGLHAVSKDGVGAEIGTVTATDTDHGLLLTPDLGGLTPGVHGFHLHEKASCEPAEQNGQMVAAAGAGGHFDPDKTGSHKGPYADGHLGDLPALTVAQDGTASLPVLAPRLDTKTLAGHAVMIHAGGDNYSDQPEKLGGGGARVACGVVE